MPICKSGVHVGKLKRGSAVDAELAIDLDVMNQRIEELLEKFEQENLSRDEALWTAAVFFLAVYNSIEEFANSELLGAASRALLKEAVDVFDSLPNVDEDEDEDEEVEEEEEEEEEQEVEVEKVVAK